MSGSFMRGSPCTRNDIDMHGCDFSMSISEFMITRHHPTVQCLRCRKKQSSITATGMQNERSAVNFTSHWMIRMHNLMTRANHHKTITI
jgi:hypothetical protein